MKSALAGMGRKWGAYALLAVGTVLALLPTVLYVATGDRIVHNYYLECFAGDIWRGVLYPRWCMEASGQLGSPVFMFYFPLAYLISSPFYALTWLGIDLDAVLSFLLWVVTFAAAGASFLWLRTLVSPLAAAAGALIFVLCPYHAELLLYRVAYAELWFMALLPLIFMQLAHVASGRPRAWVWLGLLLVAGMLVHLSGAIIAGFGAAAYLAVAWLQEGRVMVRRILLVCTSGAIGAAGSALYWLPAFYYKQFATTRPPDIKYAVVDRYPDLLYRLKNGFDISDPLVIYICTALTLLVLVGLAGKACFILRKPAAREGLSPLARELVRYAAVLAVAVFMYLPILEPVWLNSDVLKTVIFPWRFQLLWTLPLALLAALLVEAHRRKLAVLRVGDAVMLIVFLVLMSFRLVYSVSGDRDESLAEARKMMYLNVFPFAPKWLKTVNYKDYDYVAAHMDDPHILKHAPTTKVEVKTWEGGTIALHISASRADTVTLRHLYFPAWDNRISREGREEVLAVKPNAEARMEFSVPAGESEVVMRYRPYYIMWRELAGGAL